ncbi:hypothetical protein [Rhodococcus sp. 66b]|uniref:hypothetical protein n=1 Tax=Rhodococcus sp. 66b TaxID=1945511 RepID=UPI0009BB973B|nr:hypothetical protein [Rhodococcus sp. 66b]OQM82083.1 hypothetical protein B0E55_01708 [Rhodococcus sp. 66b]
MPNRVAFLCPILTVSPHELHVLGIVPCEASEEIFYQVDRGEIMAEIGALVSTEGKVYVVPRHGCTELQWSLLLGAAEYAFLSTPSAQGGWYFNPDAEECWETYVSVHIPSAPARQEALLSDQRAEDWGRAAA